MPAVRVPDGQPKVRGHNLGLWMLAAVAATILALTLVAPLVV